MPQLLFTATLMSVLLVAGAHASGDGKRSGGAVDQNGGELSAADPGSNRDNFTGTREDDFLIGTSGDDRIAGNRGDDHLLGLGGNDRLRGGRGDDDLNGGPGADVLRGNRGNDVLRSDGGFDVLVGGRGEDVFLIEAGSMGPVKIRDFDPDEDRLLIAMKGLHSLADENLVDARRGAKLVLTTNDAEVEITFLGVSKRALGEAVIEFSSDSPGYGNLRLLSLYGDALAHEGPVYLEESETLVFTSNRLVDSMGNQFVAVSSYDTDSGKTTDLGLSDLIPMANGATLSMDGGIIFDRQGNLVASAGLSHYDPDTGLVTDIISNVDDWAFNSPNDVVESIRGELWFTDPQYGFEQGFRPPPELGNWVWLYDRATEEFTVLADDLSRPNGIAFSNDERHLYVTDSGYAIGDGTIDPNGPRNVYRYRINRRHGRVFLSNRRLLATAKVGIPDGIKIDEKNRVWYATGDGLHVLSPRSRPIGSASVPGGSSNFVLTDDGIFVMGETALYMLPRDNDRED
jgi:gluconolactonase